MKSHANKSIFDVKYSQVFLVTGISVASRFEFIIMTMDDIEDNDNLLVINITTSKTKNNKLS